ncbi:hypothetical protein D3C85_1487480 [compost metagenome]
MRRIRKNGAVVIMVAINAGQKTFKRLLPKLNFKFPATSQNKILINALTNTQATASPAIRGQETVERLRTKTTMNSAKRRTGMLITHTSSANSRSVMLCSSIWSSVSVRQSS